MNQTRSFYTRVARILSQGTTAALAFDLSSSGDSSGDFLDAAWATWCEDVRAAYDWLAERTERVSIVAARSAALLIPALGAHGSRPAPRICLVDPVVDGELWLTDFLRIKVARSLFEGRRETLTSLHESLVAGATVEVAGYELSATLYQEIRGVRIATADFDGASEVQVVGDQKFDFDAFATVLPASPRVRYKVLDIDVVWTNDRPEPPPPLIDAVAEFF